MELRDLLGAQADDDGQPKKESPLKSLQADLDFYSESIKEIAVEIMAEGLSAYPIFIAHQHEVSLGELILNKDELGTNWSIQASTLEELVERGIIKEDRQAHFVKKYKKPEDFMCLFVVVPEGANFVFYPYKA
ncbi:hypothetical protein GCM10007415_05240 [Parapedobacter pyrenivorans]|uniref:Uncharacterized protein n=1 Tax=Parapedobacter pyrenivorans TaxID=1305674 RepID=A0A917HEE8_9SPHI|nr:hypothetical protein [Parapedobacter pyrenivorans]GGG76420.1 hypothetical protein GCM10007415_05240 [Parapedobacter pyrenivorans]